MQIVKYILVLISLIASIGLVIVFVKKRKISKLLLIVYVCAFSVSMLLTIQSFFDDSYYDRYGNEYEDLSSVIYYTKDNYQYVFNEDSFEFVCKNYTEDCAYKKAYEVGYAYVDENGYLFFTDDFLTVDSSNPYLFFNPETNSYCMAAEIARFDETGKIIQETVV